MSSPHLHASLACSQATLPAPDALGAWQLRRQWDGERRGRGQGAEKQRQLRQRWGEWAAHRDMPVLRGHRDGVLCLARLSSRWEERPWLRRGEARRRRRPCLHPYSLRSCCDPTSTSTSTDSLRLPLVLLLAKRSLQSSLHTLHFLPHARASRSLPHGLAPRSLLVSASSDSTIVSWAVGSSPNAPGTQEETLHSELPAATRPGGAPPSHTAIDNRNHAVAGDEPQGDAEQGSAGAADQLTAEEESSWQLLQLLQEQVEVLRQARLQEQEQMALAAPSLMTALPTTIPSRATLAGLSIAGAGADQRGNRRPQAQRRWPRSSGSHEVLRALRQQQRQRQASAQLACLREHSGPVCCLLRLENGLLLTGSDDGLVKLWA